MSVNNMSIMKIHLSTLFKSLKRMVDSGTRKEAESCLLSTHLGHSGLTGSKQMAIVRESSNRISEKILNE